MDRERLAMILGMLGSAHDGEVVNAARLAGRMLKEAGLTWPQVLDGERIATEAARVLLQENEELRARIAELSDRISDIAGSDVWMLKRENAELKDRLAELSGTPEQRREQLDLARRYVRHLDSFERDFLDTVAGWRGQLTPRQQPIWSRIVAKVERLRDRGAPP
jgi:hypothetical protein